MAARLSCLFILLLGLTHQVLSQNKIIQPKKGKITFASEISDLTFSYQHIFKDSLIVSSEKTQGIWTHNLINTNKSTYAPLEDSTMLVLETNPVKYEYSFENNPKIIEYRDEFRLIGGYNCFKVVYEQLLDSTTVKDKNVTAPEIGYTIKKEFWVTEKIKTIFNPICREKSILEKYYPLEMSCSDSAHKETIITYRLKSISLSEN